MFCSESFCLNQIVLLLVIFRSRKPSIVSLPKPVSIDREKELKRRTFYLTEEDIAGNSEKIGPTLLNRYSSL